MPHDIDADVHAPAGPVAAVATVLHPHPAMGGDRTHPLVVSLAEALASAGVLAVRPDLPDADTGAASAQLASLAGALAEEHGTDHVLLVGYSWGSVVSALTLPSTGHLAGRVLVAPPVSVMGEDLRRALEATAAPTLVLVPAHDQYGPPDAVRAALAEVPDLAIEVVEGCDHFLVGAVQRITDRAVAWVRDLLPV